MSVRVIKPQGNVRVQRSNSTTQEDILLEDDFVLQNPNDLEIPKGNVSTQFVFECDMNIIEENTIQGNKDIVESTGDTFTIGAMLDKRINSNKLEDPNTKAPINSEATVGNWPDIIRCNRDSFTLDMCQDKNAVREVNRSQFNGYIDDLKSTDKSETPVVAARQQKQCLPSIVDITKSISKVSNMIRDLCKKQELYDLLSNQSMQPQDFYTKLSNPIWKSLLQFCNIIQHNTPNNFTVPPITVDTPYIETLVFFDNIYHDTSVSLERDPLKAITGYKRVFKVEGGISSDWIPLLVTKIQEKIDIADEDVMIITEYIKGDWCYTENRGKSTQNIIHDVDENVNPGIPMIHTEVNMLDPNTTIEGVKVSDVVFSADMPGVNDDDDDETGKDEYEDELDNELEDEEILTVELQKDEGVVETIVSYSAWNGTSLMLFTDFEHMDVSAIEEVDWNWLRHFIPNAMICTENPDLFVECNSSFTGMKFIQLAKACDITKDETDPFIVVGMYEIDSSIEENGDDFIKKIGLLVELNVTNSPNLSHLARTLQMDKLFVEESKILACIGMSDDEENSDDNQEVIVEQGSDNDDISDYAAKVALNGVNNNASSNVISLHTPIDPSACDDINFEGNENNLDPDKISDQMDQQQDYHMNNNRRNGRNNVNDEFTFSPIRKNTKSSKYHDA